MDNTMASKYVRIDPRFRLRGWQGRPYALPLVGETTLAGALTDSAYLSLITTTLDEYLAHNPQCAACGYRMRCGGCRGRAAVACGGDDLPAIEPNACRPYRGGYYDRVKKLIEDAYASAWGAALSQSPPMGPVPRNRGAGKIASRRYTRSLHGD